MKAKIFIFISLIYWPHLYAASECNFNLAALSNLQLESNSDPASVLAAYREIISNLNLSNLQFLKENDVFKLSATHETRVDPIQDGLDIIQKRAATLAIPKIEFSKILNDVIQKKSERQEIEKTEGREVRVLTKSYRVLTEKPIVKSLFTPNLGIVVTTPANEILYWENPATQMPNKLNARIAVERGQLAASNSLIAYRSSEHTVQTLNLASGGGREFSFVGEPHQISFLKDGELLLVHSYEIIGGLKNRISIFGMQSESTWDLPSHWFNTFILSRSGQFAFLKREDNNLQISVEDLAERNNATPPSWKNRSPQFSAVSYNGEFALSIIRRDFPEESDFDVWDRKTGLNWTAKFKIPPISGLGYPWRFHISTDGQRIILTSDRGFIIFDSRNPNINSQPKLPGVFETIISPDDRFILGVENTDPVDELLLFDGRSGKRIHIRIPEPESKIMSASFSLDSKYLITTNKNSKTLLWDLDKAVESAGE